MLNPSILFGSGYNPLPTDPTPVLSAAASASQAPPNDDDLARLLAAVIALQSSLNSVQTLESAGQHVSTLTRDFLAAKRVVLLWRLHQGSPLRVIGDSASEPSLQASTRMLIAAGEEIIARGFSTHWPPRLPVERHAMLAVEQLAEMCAASAVSAIRLVDASQGHREMACGALIVLDADQPGTENFLQAVAIPLTGAVTRIARSQPSQMESAIRDTCQFVRQRYRLLLALTVVLAAIMLAIPIPYRVSAPLELQPETRRFIAVPFDGPLQSITVKPGDLVEQGELLAAIDPREIEFELAGVVAEWNQAEQERKSLMAKHDFPGSKLVALEADRLRLKTELLQHQRDHLEIRSPIAGVVVSGDYWQSEGMPMTRGETLFEIAPLGTMIAEIAVPESEIAEIRSGLQVEFFLHSFPARTMQGEIVRIYPRAEIREHQNVFVTEVYLQDPQGLFRPGMHGRANIVCDRHTLAWNLFHHAYFAACQWIGW